jgi:RNase P/RNase MRP subunit p29
VAWLAGVEGLVALSSSTSFHLVTAKDQHVVVPKEGCVISIALGFGQRATLVGSNLVGALQRKHHAIIPFPL